MEETKVLESTTTHGTEKKLEYWVKTTEFRGFQYLPQAKGVTELFRAQKKKSFVVLQQRQ